MTLADDRKYTYAVGRMEHYARRAFEAGPYPRLAQALDVVPDGDDAIIIRFERDGRDKVIYRWQDNGWVEVKGSL